MLTLAQEWLQEGEAKGKIETVENLLKMNMPWSFIEQATGIDQQKFQELQQQLAQFREPSV